MGTIGKGTTSEVADLAAQISTSAAKAAIQNKTVIAALKRCATRAAPPELAPPELRHPKVRHPKSIG
jgi:hypothetical protein